MDITGGEKSPLGNLLRSGDVGKAAQMAYAVLSLVDKSDGDKKTVISQLSVICIFLLFCNKVGRHKDVACTIHIPDREMTCSWLSQPPPPPTPIYYEFPVACKLVPDVAIS